MSLDLQLIVNSFFSLLDFTGLTLLSLTIYRIPVTLYWKRLIVIQFVFLAVMLVHDYIFLNRDFYTLTIPITAIILSTFLLRIPFLYSALIWGTGYLINSIMQILVALLLTETGFVSSEQLIEQPAIRNAVMFIFFLINLTIVYFMEKKRLGFMFIMNRFRMQKRNIQIKDIFITTFLLCTIGLAQWGIISFRTELSNHYLFYVLIIMIVISLVGLYVTYKFNMKEIDERFSALRGRKIDR